MGRDRTVIDCWHCGEPMPVRGGWTVNIAGQDRPVCCPGCQAAARWIQDSGLGDYYRLRDAVTRRAGPRQTDGAAARNAMAGNTMARQAMADGNHDVAGIEQHLVRPVGENAVEAIVLVEGMRCAACSWLIERLLLACEGVRSVQVNGVAMRARIVFDPARVGLAHLLGLMSRAGYRPLPLAAAQLDDLRGREARAALKRLLVAGFGAMQAMMFSTVLYVGGEDLDEATRRLFAWLGFLAASPVVIYSAAPFFQSALRLLRSRRMGMDVPVALAIALIYGASLVVAWRGSGEVYFESVAMFVFFLLIGRYLEMRARHRAVDMNDAVTRLTPVFADRIGTDGQLERVAASALKAGDRVQVAMGEALPADGVLTGSACLVDESLLTGESRPVNRQTGDTVLAGSLIVQGSAQVRVTGVGAGTTVAAIVALVSRAQAKRPALARQSEQAAARFVVRVLSLAALTALFWVWRDASRAFDATLAVLVISCPCALALAAPTALTRAVAVLTGRGALVVDPDAIEALAGSGHVIFDKTGTLTERTCRVTRIALRSDRMTEEQALRLAATLASKSRHPVSAAIVAHAGDERPPLAIEAVSERPGEGVEGRIDGQLWRLGRPAFALAARGLESTRAGVGASAGEDSSAGARTRGHAGGAADLEGAVLAGPHGAVAVFHIAEQVRPDAGRAIARLARTGITTEIASGDAPTRVAAVAHQLGIPVWHGGLLPADKLERLARRRAAGAKVVAVGDGINDAPVLAGADVSVAMAGGADLAQASSSLVLCGGRLAALADAVQVSRRTMQVLRQNQRWALFYNLSAVPLAAAGLVPPWLAALGMSLSSLVVILNGQRITAPGDSTASFDGAALTDDVATRTLPSQQPVRVAPVVQRPTR